MGLGWEFLEWGLVVVLLDRVGVGQGGKRMGRGRERRRGEAIGGGVVGCGADGDGIGERLACSVCYLLGWCILLWLGRRH